MAKTRGDQFAYPKPELKTVERGMTIREVFVMSAMQGLLANTNKVMTPEVLAESALKYADAALVKLSAKDDINNG